jgi:VanZ family protein
LNLQLQRRISRSLSAMATVLVFIAMVHPNPTVPFAFNDKFLHGLVFYALTLLFLSIRSKRQLVLIAFAMVIGCATEVAQLLVSSRQADLIDLLANFTGIAAAVATWTVFTMLINHLRRNVAEREA